MKKQFIILAIVIISSSLFAQNIELKRVEPANWWVGMENPNLQLLISGENISLTDVIIKSDKVELVKINKVENPNYLFLDLKINKNATAGEFEILFKKGRKTKGKYSYTLNQKTKRQRGFSSADVIYLLMPDRFANGNPENDSHKDMLEKANRENHDGRHGGDIQGVIDNLDYIKELGMTAVWLNPTIENNNKDYSYHGYGITDFYKTDARFGTNEDYKKLADELHEKEMKLIMDMIFNHCGINHWWVGDYPTKDWTNSNPDFRSNFRGSTIADPHASKSDEKQMVEGWFVTTMPDLNQNNKYLATYLIQNSIWWIEYADLDGIRMDTQPYPYKEFMAEWAKTVREEYPTITLLGETWLQKVPFTAYFQGDSPISGDYNSYLHSTTDFPLYYAIKDAFNEGEGWTSGLKKLYYILAQDFLYDDASRNVIFMDNHDLDRYYTSVGEDINKFKMGIAFLLTTRGIPMFYYGDEILTTGHEHKGHGHIRTDFPGGWASDKTNAFTKNGRTEEQNDIFDYITKLANWRQTNKAVTNGKLTHYIPENNTYIYFRHTENEAVMVILNNHNTENKTIDCERFNEILKDYKSGTEIITGNKIELNKIKIPKKSAMIIELK